jgi:uncharacterized protein (UPF0333 family)
MTNFIQTRSFDQRNGQGGFAIGLILLVVLLIAVIVGAIAIASRSSSSSGTQEKDRVAASSLLTQAQGLNNAFTRATDGGGIPADNVYMSYVTAAVNANVRNDQANLIGQNGFLPTPSINAQAYDATVAACPVNNIPTDVPTAPATTVTCQFILTRIALGSANGNSAVVYTKPLTQAVGRQINAVLWSTSPTLALPALGGVQPAGDLGATWGKANAPANIGNATVVTLATAALQNATVLAPWNGVTGVAPNTSQGVTGSNLPAINGTNRGEGTFTLTNAQGGPTYYRVLNNL